MFEQYQLDVGDIGLYRAPTLLGKAIRDWMNAYRIALKLPKRTLYNHVFMIVNKEGEIWVAEAKDKGVQVKPFEETYSDKMNRVKILTPNIPYTDKEKEKLSPKVIEEYSLEPHHYNFSNFIHQTRMILGLLIFNTKVWGGLKGKKAEKRLYCSEAVATWANKIRPNTFKEPWAINPLDIDLNENYHEKEYNE